MKIKKSIIKNNKRKKIKNRIRKKIFGTSERPRISVFRSNKEIYAQIINDISGITLLSASSKDKEIKEFIKNNKNNKNNKKIISYEVGKLLANKANKIGIKKVIFDRNGYLYHGRVKYLSEGLRKLGLIF
ncbi:50S ribosomal protein L18 [Candidatus Shikimatogenerans silvanidophilus]|uniref:50S ribosomal protein L18 n=1 Tax=Candidatus Shikimatogenerans silvanidophilus TaxID=2782547 RepID=UPI001BAC5085|nr:50S ribosomal protein L18 [Candidatus Shikimatogenerans silvanidophilus]